MYFKPAVSSETPVISDNSRIQLLTSKDVKNEDQNHELRVRLPAFN